MGQRRAGSARQTRRSGDESVVGATVNSSRRTSGLGVSRVEGARGNPPQAEPSGRTISTCEEAKHDKPYRIRGGRGPPYL